MLIRFSVTNYRSIRDRQDFSFEASTLKEEVGRTIPTQLTGVELLPAAAVYGANASGKTNLLRALRYATRVVLNSHSKWRPDEGVPRNPFCLDGESVKKPTEFEFDLLLSDVRYTFGFAVNSKKVLREYVYAYPNGRAQTWYERDGTGDIKFGKLFGTESKNKTIWSITRPNSLFLSAAAQNNHEELSPLYRWFSTQVRFAYPSDKQERMRATIRAVSEGDGGEKEFLQSLLALADLGIIGIEVRKQDPPKEVRDMIAAMRLAVPPNVDTQFVLEPGVLQAALLHKAEGASSGVPLPLTAESDGTQAVFALGEGIVRTLACGGLLCIDELEESLHPLLALQILRLFEDPKANPHDAQLLFTTHSTTLLAQRALRRDQIWFTEKDATGTTRLYALADYKPRRDENLETGYLQGRYGAIPFLETAAWKDFIGSEVGCGETTTEG